MPRLPNISPPSASIKHLLDVSKQTFRGNTSKPKSDLDLHQSKIQSSSKEFQEITNTLNRIDFEDLRSFQIPYADQVISKYKGFNCVSYYPIHENEDFTMAVFVLPQNSFIPLHDHPGMTVFSKLIYGTIHVRAYDIIPVTNRSQLSTSFHLATKVLDDTFSAPAQTRMLYPYGNGNVHTLRALQTAAFLDILTPSYASPQRECNYYKECGTYSFNKDKGSYVLINSDIGGQKLPQTIQVDAGDIDKAVEVTLLERIPPPPDFICD